jgi:hypothetical protein
MLSQMKLGFGIILLFSLSRSTFAQKNTILLDTKFNISKYIDKEYDAPNSDRLVNINKNSTFNLKLVSGFQFHSH